MARSKRSGGRAKFAQRQRDVANLEAVFGYVAEGQQTQKLAFQELAYQAYHYKSAAPVPVCVPGCSTCKDQYVPQLAAKSRQHEPFLRSYNDSAAQRVITDLVSRTQDDFHFLEEILRSHGAYIGQAWNKLDDGKATRLLRSVDPLIAPSRHSNIERAVRRAQHGGDLFSNEMGGTKSRKMKSLAYWFDKNTSSVLAPWLTIESLIEGFPALLHGRTAADPSEWLMFDMHQLKLAFHECLVENVAWNPHCVVVHGETYGTLVPWEAAASHRWDIVGCKSPPTPTPLRRSF